MCLAPATIYQPNGSVQISCRKCWQCRERAINDWVGRNIAESKTATASHAITLTYGTDENGESDHPSARVLTYSDVQKYFKKLRFNGFPLRYFAIGEYGSEKGRAHWHIMAYWQGAVPEHEIGKRFTEQHWEHGISFWERPYPEAIRYNCKYIQKDIGADNRQGHMAMSKLPPLGTEYFRKLAETYVVQGLAPQTLEYTFPEVTRVMSGGKREPVRFMLKDTPARQFLDHFISKWEQTYPGVFIPASELVEEYIDSKTVRTETDLVPDPRQLGEPRPVPQNLLPYMDSWKVYFDETAKHWAYKHSDSDKPLYYTRMVGGKPEWRMIAETGVAEVYQQSDQEAQAAFLRKVQLERARPDGQTNRRPPEPPPARPPLGGPQPRRPAPCAPQRPQGQAPQS